MHHKLLLILDGRSVAKELQAALEAAQGARPRVVTITAVSSSMIVDFLAHSTEALDAPRGKKSRCKSFSLTRWNTT